VSGRGVTGRVGTDKARSWLGRVVWVRPIYPDAFEGALLLNLSHSRRTFINKSSHAKRNDILYKFLNKMNGQTWCQKSQTSG